MAQQSGEHSYGKGYGKKPIWFWILLYVIIGGIIYGLIYYFVFAKSGGYTTPTTKSSNSGTTQTPTTAPARGY